MIECCLNCEYCLAYPKGNKYGDVDYLCISTGYYVSSVKKDRNKLKRYTPAGSELVCKYKPVKR